MSNIEDLKPYDYHAFIVAKNGLMNACKDLGANELVLAEIERWFILHVYEFGITSTLDLGVLSKYKEDIESIKMHQMNRNFMKLADTIKQSNAFSVIEAKNYHEALTTVKILVLNFDK